MRPGRRLQSTCLRTEAGRVYRRIEAAKGKGRFITEVSMDETDAPQTPEELLLILAGACRECVPAQTIAPKFTGPVQQGVDYGETATGSESEFPNDLAVIAARRARLHLPCNLKLSVHSGSEQVLHLPGDPPQPARL